MTVQANPACYMLVCMDTTRQFLRRATSRIDSYSPTIYLIFCFAASLAPLRFQVNPIATLFFSLAVANYCIPSAYWIAGGVFHDCFCLQPDSLIKGNRSRNIYMKLFCLQSGCWLVVCTCCVKLQNSLVTVNNLNYWYHQWDGAWHGRRLTDHVCSIWLCDTRTIQSSSRLHPISKKLTFWTFPGMVYLCGYGL